MANMAVAIKAVVAFGAAVLANLMLLTSAVQPGAKHLGKSLRAVWTGGRGRPGREGERPQRPADGNQAVERSNSAMSAA